MRIVTWNVNSIRQRIDHLSAFIAASDADILCLQELKCQEDGFPRAAIEDLGYNVAILGQKGFNGVAILSRLPLEDVTTGLPGDDEDTQSRYIEAVVSTPAGALRVASIYLPNGNPVETEKFTYKLSWMDRLHAHAQRLLAHEEMLVLAGDYNVIPTADDVHDPAAWAGDALFQPESRARFQALAHMGFTDALRATTDAAGLYTFWDYQAGAWAKNHGIRIDHLMLSPQAADRLRNVTLHKDERARDKPSDHIPVSVDLAV